MSRTPRLLLCLCLVASLLVLASGPASARAGWKERLDRRLRGYNVSVSVRDGGRDLYRWNAAAPRTPASNEKLLLSMALLDTFATDQRITTTAAAKAGPLPRISGDLYLLGRGDPSITGGGRFGKNLPFEPTRLGDLARRIKAAGVRRIDGSVIGSTSYFSRDWWATGWKSNFPRDEIPLPTALSFEGNVKRGRHITNPERRAARALTHKLRSLGVAVVGKAKMGPAPTGLAPVAAIESAPWETLLQYMNRHSSNYFAETFLKRLGFEQRGVGSIPSGAAALRDWMSANGVSASAYDGSGLSYSNRITPRATAVLLGRAEQAAWGDELLGMLPKGGQGTLEDRLHGVPVRAKTGTLTGISTLSGYVRLAKTGTWAEFSIMSVGMYKPTAAALEDDVVRVLVRRAQPSARTSAPSAAALPAPRPARPLISSGR